MTARELINKLIEAWSIDSSLSPSFILNEGITLGIRNALGRMPHREVCGHCKFTIPIYPGRYPGSCPDCGAVFPKMEIAKSRKIRKHK